MEESWPAGGEVTMTFLCNKWFLLTLRIIIGGVFVYAGASKITDPQSFADSIATFQILPKELINLVALGLPPFEIITGTMLILGLQKRLATFCLLVLTAIFILALAQGLLRGLPIDCGCFGSGEPSLTKNLLSLARDVVLLLFLSGLFATASQEQQKR